MSDMTEHPTQPAGVRLTPKMLDWLTYLGEHGPSVCKGRGNIGHRCRVAGLTEWDYRGPETKLPISPAEAEVRFGSFWFIEVHLSEEERLTPAGRSLLAQTEGDR